MRKSDKIALAVVVLVCLVVLYLILKGYISVSDIGDALRNL